MTIPAYGRFSPGPLSRDDAELLNRILEDLRKLQSLSVSGPLRLIEGPGGYQIALDDTGNDDFFARITGPAVSGAYPWTEQEEQPNGTFIDLPGGRTGTTSASPAYEETGNTSVPTNSIVLLRRGYVNSTTGQEYLFAFAGGGGGLTVQGVNPGTGDPGAPPNPNLTGVTTLEIDEASGLAVVSDAGKAKVSAQAASGNHAGSVSLADQFMGAGSKKFQAVVQIFPVSPQFWGIWIQPPETYGTPPVYVTQIQVFRGDLYAPLGQVARVVSRYSFDRTNLEYRYAITVDDTHSSISDFLVWRNSTALTRICTHGIFSIAQCDQYGNPLGSVHDGITDTIPSGSIIYVEGGIITGYSAPASAMMQSAPTIRQAIQPDTFPSAMAETEPPTNLVAPYAAADREHPWEGPL